MKTTFVRLIALASFATALSPAKTLGSQNLIFDAEKNKVDIIGPFIKYNFLNPPFSFGTHPIAKADFSITVGESENGKSGLWVRWPSFFMQRGVIKVVGRKRRTWVKQKFDNLDIEADESGSHRTHIPMAGKSLEAALKGPLQFCITDSGRDYKVTGCSDRLKPNGDSLVPVKETKNTKIQLNGKPLPKNAQIEIPPSTHKIDLKIQMDSGFKIRIKTRVHRVKLADINLNIHKKTVGISPQGKKTRKAKLTWKEKIKKYIGPRNYYQEKFKDQEDWPIALKDVEMEFSSSEEVAGALIYGLSFSEIPTKDFAMRLDKKAPIATYNKKVVLRGFKDPDESIFGTSKGSLKVSSTGDRFLWTFNAPKKGDINKDHLVYGQPNSDSKFYFSRRVFRGHQFSIALDGTIGTSLALEPIFGYMVQAEYWPEKVFSRHPALFQRWGIGVSRIQTFSPLTITRTFSDDSPSVEEEWQIHYTRIDLMGRFSKGVRPVKSSFGAMIRYNIPTFVRPTENTSPHLLGVGLFWHTAPFRIVDEILNVAPFFRYPKWLELSAVYYPVSLSGNFNLGFALSYDARGRIFFAPQWFLSASTSATLISFEKTNDIRASVGTLQGTIGIGYQF